MFNLNFHLFRINLYILNDMQYILSSNDILIKTEINLLRRKCIVNVLIARISTINLPPGFIFLAGLISCYQNLGYLIPIVIKP